MTRRAYPPAMVARAAELRSKGCSYRVIVRVLYEETGIEIGQSTVRDWVTYRTRMGAERVDSRAGT